MRVTHRCSERIECGSVEKKSSENSLVTFSDVQQHCNKNTMSPCYKLNKKFELDLKASPFSFVDLVEGSTAWRGRLF